MLASYLLCVFGLSIVVTSMHVGEPVRALFMRLGRWGTIFITCPGCVSFWVGLALSLVYSPSRAFSPQASAVVAHLADAFAATGTSLVLAALLGRLIVQPVAATDPRTLVATSAAPASSVQPHDAPSVDSGADQPSASGAV